MSQYIVPDIETSFNEGNYERVFELLQIEKSKSSPVTPISLAELYYFECRTYERIGKWKKAWEIYLESNEKLCNNINCDPRVKLIILATKTYLLWRLSKLDEGILVIEENKKFLIEIESKIEDLKDNFAIENWLGLYYIIISNFYLQLGILNIAWDLNEKSYKFYSKINYELYIGKIMANFGEIHLLRGEINQSLEKYQKSVELSTKTNDPITSIEGFFNIGQIYYFLSNTETALEYYQKAIKISESLNNYYYEARINYQVLILYYNLSENEKVHEIVNKLKKLNELAPDNKYIDQLTIIAMAVDLLLNESFKNIVKAQELLTTIYEGPVINFELYFFVMVLLTEIRLLEYKIFDNKTILDEINDLIDRMFSLATKNESTRLIIESIVLQAKIEIISGNLENADTLFNQAKLKAIEKNLNILLEKIKKEHQLFKQQAKKWKKMLNENATSHERLQYAELKSYIQELKKEINLDKFV